MTFESGESRFEPELTPSDAVTLEWDTFSEAADEAGISRLYGGIHFEDGDLNGRDLGRQVGAEVYKEAQFFINGGDKERPTLFCFNWSKINSSNRRTIRGYGDLLTEAQLLFVMKSP